MNATTLHQPTNPNNMTNSHNQDETFLHLLSSQRELLTQLNRENPSFRWASSSSGYQGACAFGGYDSMFPGNNSTNVQTSVSPNHSIDDPSSLNADNVVYSKRFSLGLGNDFFGMAPDDLLMTKVGNSSSFGPDPIGCDIMPPANSFPTRGSCSNFNNKKRDKDDMMGLDDTLFAKKRRLSAAGLIQSYFGNTMDEPQQLGPHVCDRRFSLSSFMDGADCGFSGSTVPEEEEGLLLPAAAPTKQPVKGVQQASQLQKPKQPHQPQMATMDAQETREFLTSLSTSMEKSQKSQQDIHDWDRKMGLKRSHSKTMRLSTRSRKKLRAMLKKQINALSPKNKR